mgnify:CR=1 FL=1
MKLLKNKILIKLIFIISILMIVALNLFGEIEESIEFNYYYYTNKIYHSTLKTEIIPSEYVFINTYSNENSYENTHSYLYNLKTKEKKLFYIFDKGYNKDYKYYEYYEYYDIKGNLTTNWTDENMKANGFYEITNNRFGETFYTLKFDSYDYEGKKLTTTIRINKDNDYIQKAYKYSLTQPEIINKKDRGIYLFDRNSYSYLCFLCFQNEYYKKNYDNYFEESGLLNYNSNGNIELSNEISLTYSKSVYDSLFFKTWLPSQSYYYWGTNINIINTFDLNKKTLSIKPNITSYNKFMNDTIELLNRNYGNKEEKYFYTEDNLENNLNKYKNSIVKFRGFIPIEEFEYYLLAD